MSTNCQDAIRRLNAGTACANVFMTLINIQSKAMDVTNDAIVLGYMQQQLASSSYDAHVAQWQADAATLPEAGKEGDSAAETNINGTGIATVMVSAVVVGIIVAAIVALSAETLGLGVIAAGFVGGMLVGLAASLGTVYGSGVGGTTTTIASHTNYDPGKQNQANSQVQLDQQLVQQDQNLMNKISSQMISPSNDAKTQQSNMIAAAIQNYKNMLWTQGAA